MEGEWRLPAANQNQTKAKHHFFKLKNSQCVPSLMIPLMGMSLYTHQCVHAACAYYMYAFVLFADHGLWPGQLPGEASGVYLSMSEHYGVWHQQHPLPEGGVWRVSQTETSQPQFDIQHMSFVFVLFIFLHCYNSSRIHLISRDRLLKTAHVNFFFFFFEGN